MILTTEDIFFEHDCNATLYTFRLENFSNRIKILSASVVNKNISEIRVIRVRLFFYM